MPCAYDVLAGLRLALVRVHTRRVPNATGAEVGRAYAYADAFGDERWQPAWNVCRDGSAVSTFMLVRDDVPAFLRSVRALGDRAGPGRSTIPIGRPEDGLTAQHFPAPARRHPDRDPGRHAEQFHSVHELAARPALDAVLDRARTRLRTRVEASAEASAGTGR